MKIDGRDISLQAFCEASRTPRTLEVDLDVISKIAAAHQQVEEIAGSEKPVYGLNTGLGANLGHRLEPDEIVEFQHRIIAGRAVSFGDPLPENVGRGVLLSRILTASKGLSGISDTMFLHLCAVYEAGLAPAIPEYGSIGAGDLTQNAHFGLAVTGGGELWQDRRLVKSETAFDALAIVCPDLRPKDGMVLVSHSGVTVALAAFALQEARRALDMMKVAIVLSYEGYQANRQILSSSVNRLRSSPGQAEAARWFSEGLAGSGAQPRRIQEALSFRTVAPIVGAAEQALLHAISVWEDEINGVPDSPVITDDSEMLSTPNFLSPALALALETVSLSLASVANGSVQRMQRMMDPELSGLPRYLSPQGGGAAGFVPTQKTAAALLAEIRHAAHPIMFDPAPVSDAVEDMASMTPATAKKLQGQSKPFQLLAALEGLVACQAIDLRGNHQLGKIAGQFHPLLRNEVPFLNEDRPLGPNIERTRQLLLTYVN